MYTHTRIHTWRSFVESCIHCTGFFLGGGVMKQLGDSPKKMLIDMLVWGSAAMEGCWLMLGQCSSSRGSDHWTNTSFLL